MSRGSTAAADLIRASRTRSVVQFLAEGVPELRPQGLGLADLAARPSPVTRLVRLSPRVFADRRSGQRYCMEGTRRAVPPVIRVRHGLGVSERPIAVVHVEGEHDIESRPLLVEVLDPLEGHVIIDLASCTFLDTSVIGAILGKALALGKRGYRLEVVVPPGADFLNRTVARLGLRDLVPIVDGPPRMHPTE